MAWLKVRGPAAANPHTNREINSISKEGANAATREAAP